ncbi:hypothetical protein FOA52_001767 [Chlamydomonas sp. UWO 241]|nr:hypothetical protein FOA52_001767 [Chlamydomonas sp. UWO 241]
MKRSDVIALVRSSLGLSTHKKNKLVSALRSSGHHGDIIRDCDLQLYNLSPYYRGKVEEGMRTGVAGESGSSLSKELQERVHGIGKTTADRLVTECGVASFDDLLARADEFGMRRKQLVGLAIARRPENRIPRAEMETHETVLVEAFKDGYSVALCGSYRRGESDCGNVDLLICPKTFDGCRDATGSDGDIDARLARAYGGGVCRLSKTVVAVSLAGGENWRRLDVVWEPRPESWSFALMHCTGPNRWNYRLCRRAIEMGYVLNASSLRHAQSRSEMTGLSTERQVCEFIGIQYLPPDKRA